MERSINFSSENIMSAVKDLYRDLLEGPESEVKKRLKRVIVAATAAITAVPGAAFADDAPTG